jgi:hypothetical protein
MRESVSAFRGAEGSFLPPVGADNVPRPHFLSSLSLTSQIVRRRNFLTDAMVWIAREINP